MTRLSAKASKVNGSPKPGQFTIRSLLVVTFCLAILLTISKNLPYGGVAMVLATLAIVYWLVVLWGILVSLVGLFRGILHRLRS